MGNVAGEKVGSSAGGIGYEIEGADGRIAKYAIIASAEQLSDGGRAGRVGGAGNRERQVRSDVGLVLPIDMRRRSYLSICEIRASRCLQRDVNRRRRDISVRDGSKRKDESASKRTTVVDTHAQSSDGSPAVRRPLCACGGAGRPACGA